MALVAEGKTNKEIAVSLNLSDKTVGHYLEKSSRNFKSPAALKRLSISPNNIQKTRGNLPYHHRGNIALLFRAIFPYRLSSTTRTMCAWSLCFCTFITPRRMP